MTHEDRVFTLLIESNPIPDLDSFDLEEIGGTAYLATLEQRSSEVTQLSTKQRDSNEKKRSAAAFLGAAAVVIIAGIGVFALTQRDNVPAAGAATVLTDYLEVWNSEDAEAVMVFYADDAVIEGHPEDPDGLTTGKSEILVIEQQMDILQGSTGTMEYINLDVSGNTGDL